MLEPLPETQQALQEYLTLEEPELGGVLDEMAREVHRLVPETVGLSLSMVEHELTFTLVAPSLRIAALDAMQYVEDGPCERAAATGEVVSHPAIDPLDEDTWQLYAQASAAVGVRSTLSVPIRVDGEVVGGVNLYASAPDAFEGHHEELARLLGASAADIISNADLSFATRLKAVQAPAKLRALSDMDTAIGILAARFGESVEESRERLRLAAASSGVGEDVVARVVVLLHAGR